MVSYEEYLRVALMAAKEAGDALSLIQNGLLQTPFQIILSRFLHLNLSHLQVLSYKRVSTKTRM